MKRTYKELTEYAQSIADDITRRRKTQPIKIVVRELYRGHAHIESRFVSVPTSAYYLENLEYFTYYTIHEITHLIANTIKHNADFKRVERHELKLWGLNIEYRRAYPSKLIANGQVCYENKRKGAK